MCHSSPRGIGCLTSTAQLDRSQSPQPSCCQVSSVRSLSAGGWDPTTRGEAEIPQWFLHSLLARQQVVGSYSHPGLSKPPIRGDGISTLPCYPLKGGPRHENTDNTRPVARKVFYESYRPSVEHNRTTHASVVVLARQTHDNVTLRTGFMSTTELLKRLWILHYAS